MKLYKYLPREYLNSLVVEGKFLFRTLSYFQDFEDNAVRGDTFEGIQKYSKPEGIDIRNVSREEDLEGNWTFKASAKSEEIFIFSTSKILSKSLADEFKSDVCVEFHNFGQVRGKLNTAIRMRKKVKPNKLLSLDVEYYKESEAPGISWAFPEKISSRKLEYFSKQQEHRLMFSVNNALDFGNTTQELQLGNDQNNKQNKNHSEQILKVGNIKKWCTIHEFA